MTNYNCPRCGTRDYRVSTASICDSCLNEVLEEEKQLVGEC